MEYRNGRFESFDIMGFHVDDGITAHTDDEPGDKRADRCIAELSTVLPIEDKGIPHSFLGMIIKYTHGECSAYQPYLIEKVTKLMGVQGCKPVHTPIRIGFDVPRNEGPPHSGFTNVSYATIVGMINYLACCTRPDLTNAVRLAASHNSNPSKKAWILLQDIVKYIWTTRDWVITFKKEAPFHLPGLNPDLNIGQPYFTTFSDSDHGSNANDCVSVSGFVSFIGGSPLNWSSKKQKGAVTLSSMEAEVIAAML